ncbi:MAG: hypothetical protein PHQ23_16425, partial [Candidatus Wallbacteria bacterium]|nr:hypothetical protein [Candidatus Wallbacteria bacterium]
MPGVNKSKAFLFALILFPCAFLLLTGSMSQKGINHQGLAKQTALTEFEAGNLDRAEQILTAVA